MENATCISSFDAAFAALVSPSREGGYVNSPADPGGETKFGISKRSYPNLDIRALTLDQAKTIYRRDFWDSIRADDLPPEVRFHIFDARVNSGRGNAVRWLQRAVWVADDGILGPVTMRAIARCDANALAARVNGIRLDFMSRLSTWDSFSRGWTRRIADNLCLIPSSTPPGAHAHAVAASLQHQVADRMWGSSSMYYARQAAATLKEIC